MDKFMEVERFNEELELLQKEMIGYLKYYKDTALTSLNKQRDELRDLLRGTYLKILLFLN